MTNEPTFSVVIPTCHRNDSLALCLDRLAPGAQTLPFDRYEVIVTDDGTETTAEDLVRQRYPWAQWTQGPRRGPAANRNHGASLARGEWLAFTDDDCLPSNQWLCALLEASASEAVAMEGSVRPIGRIGADLADCPVNLSGGLFASANISVRRRVFKDIGGFDERYAFWCEDQDLLARCRACGRVEFVPDAIVDHPVRILKLREALERIPAQCSAQALYYSINDRRLGIRRFTTLIRWLYKPRIVALGSSVVRLRPRSALVEAMWVLVGNPRVLREYIKMKRSLATKDS